MRISGTRFLWVRWAPAITVAFVSSGCGQVATRLGSLFDDPADVVTQKEVSTAGALESESRPETTPSIAKRVANGEREDRSPSHAPAPQKIDKKSVETARTESKNVERDSSRQPHPQTGFHVHPEQGKISIGSAGAVFDMSGDLPEVRTDRRLGN